MRPLFIDEKVEAFYDAAPRPDFEGTAVTRSNSIAASTTIDGGSHCRRGDSVAANDEMRLTPKDA